MSARPLEFAAVDEARAARLGGLIARRFGVGVRQLSQQEAADALTRRCRVCDAPLKARQSALCSPECKRRAHVWHSLESQRRRKERDAR